MLQHATRFLRNGGHFAMFELLYMRRDLVKMSKYVVVGVVVCCLLRLKLHS
jgi:hypothetical protein